MLWNNELGFEIQQYSKNHIHGLIALGLDSEQKWFLTGLYGHPDVAKRLKTWNILKLLKLCDDQPWLVQGDLNEIMHLSDKWGGRNRPKK